jgi:tol-pal system protein YbgF
VLSLTAAPAIAAVDDEARLQISRYQSHLVQVQNQLRTIQDESSAVKARYDGLHEVQRDLNTRFLSLREQQDSIVSEWNALQSSHKKLAAELASVRAQLDTRSQSMPQPEMILAQADTTGGRGMVQLLNQMDTLNAELNKLRGKMEELGHGVTGAEKRQRDMYLDLDTRMRRIEQNVLAGQKKDQETITALEERLRKLEQQVAAGGHATIPAPVNTAAGSDVPPPGTPGNASAGNNPSTTGGASNPSATVASAESPQRTYDSAMSSYRSSDYQGAINGFSGFLNQFPQHTLAANAQYWIGDAYFQLRDYQAAIDAQRKLISSYPDSPKVPDAMLNLGSAELGLGDAAAARKTWEEVVAKYSGTDAAEKARQRLTRLR